MTQAFLAQNPGWGGVGVPAVPPPDIDAWVGVPAPAIQGGTGLQAQAAALPALAGGIAAAIRWLLAQFGLKQVLVAIASFVGIGAFKGGLDEIPELAASVIPGLQPWLGEYPAGLGSIEGRIVRRWTAGGARVFFATFEQPTRQGSHLQHYVYSPKRGAWLPYSLRRNVVFGAKELDVAAALSGKKRISKKRALRALAGRTPRRSCKKED